jgi:subtilase family serine protease
MRNTNSRSRPYKKASTLNKNIEKFLTKHSATFRYQGSRISHFFEMTCYNDVVKYYEKNGFVVSPRNLQDKVFRYKISANGNPDNFSHFLVTKTIRGKEYKFEIHHNLSIECPYEKEIFYTADISVINSGTIERRSPETYTTKRSCCAGDNVQTFFEIKHLSPFPELLFSFTGIPDNLLKRDGRVGVIKHLAPSLVMSGRANYHGEQIRKYLEGKYEINIIFDLFGSPASIYRSRPTKKKVGTLLPEEEF